MTSSFIEVKVAANCKLFLAFYNIISFTNKRFNLKFLPNFAAMLQKLPPGHIPKQASSTWCLLSSPSKQLPGNSQPNCAIMFLPNESPQIKEHRSLGLFTFNHICLMSLFLCQLEQTYLHIFMGYVASFKLCNSVLCTSVSWLLYFW